MKSLKSTIIIILCLAAVGLLIAKDPDYKYSDKVDFKNIDILKMKIHFPAGELYVSTHDLKFFNADCEYSEEEWKPEIFYERRNEEGRLLIDVPEFDFPIDIDDDDIYRWDLMLSREVPTDLRINMKAGEGKLNLNDMDLRRFEFTMFGGELKINLKNSSPEKINFRALAGEAKVDLSGIYTSDLDAEFTCGFGELTIYLPKNVESQVEVNGVLGQVNAPEFSCDDDYYVNNVSGSKHKITLSVTGGIGEVNLRLAAE